MRKMLILCLAFIFAFTSPACSYSKQPNGTGQQMGDGSMTPGDEQTRGKGYGAVLNAYGIDAPVSRPSIYVNMAGYAAGRGKKVVFAGECQGQTFRIVRKKDGSEVYKGVIPASVEDTQSGRYLSVADFTSLDEPGTYYFYTDKVGQSYPFGIAEDAYENMFLGILRNVSEANMQENAQGVCDTSFGMHAVMYALMSNGALFETAYGHLGKDEQDKQLVTQLLYVAKRLISQQKNDGSLYGDYGATAAFCGIMAMSRNMFGRYEASVDKEYKQAAERAWSWLEGQAWFEGQESARFYAAAQLFHENGGETYKKIAEDFLRKRGRDYSSDKFVFYGVLAYISSESGTDRDLCTYVMADLMNKTEEICADVRKDTVFGTGSRTLEGNLANMLHLSFVNYLTPNKEYTAIIESAIQYIGGLNDTGTCYVGTDGIWKNMEATHGRNLEWNGILLLSMGDMLKNFSVANE